MKKMLYFHTSKGQIISYQIEPKKIYVGQDDLYVLLEAIDELGETIRQAEAYDLADTGIDDREAFVDDDGVERCPGCGIDRDFEDHEESCPWGRK